MYTVAYKDYFYSYWHFLSAKFRTKTPLDTSEQKFKVTMV